MSDLDPEPAVGPADAGGTGVDADADASRVLVLVSHDRNARLLAGRLSETYRVIETPPADVADARFDACIVDAAAFERHHEALDRRKRTAEPTFLPCLFLTKRSRDEPLPDAVWETVDEVLRTPLDPAELHHRLDNLLERRRLSLDLDHRRQRSEKRFESLFRTAPDPILVTTADGVVSEANEAFARAVGTPRTELIGRPVADLGFSASTTVERVLLRAVEADADPESVRVTFGASDPTITELNTAAVSPSDRIGIFRDVTDSEKRETALREQNQRLERVASTIAHDLRNPLSVARGHLDIAVADDGGDRTDHLDAVVQAHERMGQLIDEILTLARQGQEVMDSEAVAIDTVSTRAWRHVDTGDATLSVTTDREVTADGNRVCELLENLFRNAVEHGSTSPRSWAPEDSVEHGSTDNRTQSGDAVEHDSTGPRSQAPEDSGGRSPSGSRPEADDSVEHGPTSNRTDPATDAQRGSDPVAIEIGWLDEQAGFYVADDGPGIPAADRTEVFEAGYTTTADGTGFGLSIVRRIAEDHGWSVSVVESDRGGARFEFAGIE
jgi:PAS domain S-box-containing protein